MKSTENLEICTDTTSWQQLKYFSKTSWMALGLGDTINFCTLLQAFLTLGQSSSCWQGLKTH